MGMDLQTAVWVHSMLIHILNFIYISGGSTSCLVLLHAC